MTRRAAVAASAVALAAGLAWAPLAPGAAAQDVTPAAAALAGPRPIPGGPEPRAYLITIGRGDAVWERYGHNAIVLHDPAWGPDVAYNWGEFDFRQPNFLGRFLTGDTKYAMHGRDAAQMVELYAREDNRAVWLQELALTPAQFARLAALVRANDTEAARYYRYDYYNDNCSTRVRDALDAALGGAVRAQLAGRPSGTTWRADTRRLNAGDAAIYTGIQLALGRPADRPLDRWAAGYLPLDLRASARGVRVPDAAGRPAPLVRAEYTLWDAPGRAADAAEPPAYAGWYLAAGAALAAAFALLGRGARGGGTGARALLGGLGAVWALAVGALGTALLLAGTVTKHAAYMGRNWNLLGANPLALVLAALVAGALAGRAGPARARRARRAELAAGAVAALAAAGLAAVVLPGVGQRSAELFALLVPAHAGLWWGLRTAARGAAGGPAAGPAGHSEPAGG